MRSACSALTLLTKPVTINEVIKNAAMAMAAVTGLYFWLDLPLVSAAFTYLIVIVLLSLVNSFTSLIALSFIAMKLGIDKTAMIRVRGGISYALW